MKTTFIVGTRGSQLAVSQTNWVISQLKKHYRDYDFKIQIIKTQGDIKKDVPLEIIGGKGVFVKQIQIALLEGTIDLAVHSMKDVPARLPEGLTMGAVPIRENPQDVLISASGLTMADLPQGSRIGTSSLRRGMQVRQMRPDIQVLPIRGNVETRIKKMREGQYDGIILAAAGIHRLGHDLKSQITEYLSTEDFVPAIGQGALGIEVRVGSEAESLVKAIHHPETGYAVTAERAFLRKLNGNCKIPIAAYGTVDQGYLTLRGAIAQSKDKKLYFGSKKGTINESQEVGSALAQELIDAAGITLEDWLKIQEERMD